MPDDELTTLGGYRLVRRLGSGSRADVYLGVASVGTAALKIYRETTPRDDIGRELDALGRLDSVHCVRIVDVVTAASGLPAAILTRVGRGSAAQLLRERASIEPGEAVTLLGPLVGAVRAAHAVGVAHSRIGAASVHLGSAGEPVLLGFGHVELMSAGPATIAPSLAVLDADPAAERDRDALASLVAFALSHVRGAESNGRVAELARWLDASAGSRRVDFTDELESRIYDLAPPLALEFGQVTSSAPVLPGRIPIPGAGSGGLARPVEGPLPPGSSTSESSTSESSPDELLTRRARTARERAATSAKQKRRPARSLPQDDPDAVTGWVPDWLHEAIMTNPAAAVRGRVASSLRDVRKPVWVVAGVVAAALVTALTIVPQGDGSTAARADQPRAAAASHEPSSTDIPVSSSSPQPDDPMPDDPVLALPLLLARRATCIEDRSVLCLAAVDESASGALASDSTLVRSLQSGGERTAAATVIATAPVLVERLGDSALVSLGPKSSPASVLMIREEAGWRIRSYLSGKPAKSTAPE